MKRKASALTFIFALLISLLIPIVAEAQLPPEPPDVDTLGPVLLLPITSDKVLILSPTNSMMGYVNQIQLVFAIEAHSQHGQFGNVGVSLDGGIINCVDDFVGHISASNNRVIGYGDVMLPTLSEGTHRATVYYGWQYLGVPEYPDTKSYQVFALATVDFTVIHANSSNVSTPVIDLANAREPEISTSSLLNMTLNVNSPALNFTLSYNYPIALSPSVSYSIDGKDYITILSGKQSSIVDGGRIFTPYNFKIDNLSDGLHNLTVYAEITNWYYGSSSDSCSVQLTIDTSPPAISGLSILNKTYNSQDIPLSFNLDENTSWVAYNLDNQRNSTLQGNVTLTGLSDGSHSIVVYANDTLGNMGKSDTVFFTVNTLSVEDFISAIVLSGVIVIVVAVGLLVYFKKRKH